MAVVVILFIASFAAAMLSIYVVGWLITLVGLEGVLGGVQDPGTVTKALIVSAVCAALDVTALVVINILMRGLEDRYYVDFRVMLGGAAYIWPVFAIAYFQDWDTQQAAGVAVLQRALTIAITMIALVAIWGGK